MKITFIAHDSHGKLHMFQHETAKPKFNQENEWERFKQQKWPDVSPLDYQHMANDLRVVGAVQGLVEWLPDYEETPTGDYTAIKIEEKG